MAKYVQGGEPETFEDFRNSTLVGSGLRFEIFTYHTTRDLKNHGLTKDQHNFIVDAFTEYVNLSEFNPDNVYFHMKVNMLIEESMSFSPYTTSISVHFSVSERHYNDFCLFMEKCQRDV